jgi:DNA invertase Pin-like site-specific DNA recombinase
MSAPLRPAIYCRVSSAEQIDGYSLSQQEKACRSYCEAHGWGEPVVYIDAGRSAFTERTEKRPQFARMLDAAVAGEHDVIVIHKLDRFARSLVTTLRELQRLEAARVGFVSIAESMDFTTPIGRVILSVLGAFAEYYSRNLSTEVRKGLAGRKAAGFRHSSLPYGARLVGGVGPAIEVDPAKADDLARILDVAAAHSYGAAALRLNAAGVPSRRGGEWWGVAVAEVVEAASWLLDQPPPWPERYLAARDRPKAPSVRGDRLARPLTGLMRCGTCGGAITYAGSRADGSRGVQCWRGPGERARCLPGAPRKTAAKHYERAVCAWVADLPEEHALLRAATRLAARADPALADLAAIAEARRELRLSLKLRLIDEEEAAIEAAALLERERAIAPRSPDVFRHAAQLVALRETLPRLMEEQPEMANAALRAVLQAVRITGQSVEVVPVEEVASILRESGRVVAVA